MSYNNSKGGIFTKTYLTKRTCILLIFLAVLAAAFILRPVPEPELCALCGDGIPYHAPVLLDLSTGTLLELQVYQRHPSKVGEIADNQRTDYMALIGLGEAEGLWLGGRSCEIALPSTRKPMNKAVFCRACREFIRTADDRGYVLLDLHDLSDIHVYPILDDTTYFIRDYTVDIENCEDTYTILVKGHV